MQIASGDKLALTELGKESFKDAITIISHHDIEIDKTSKAISERYMKRYGNKGKNNVVHM